MRLLLCLLLYFPFWGHLSAQYRVDRKVLSLEQHRFEYMTAGDTAQLRKLLSKDLKYIHSNALTETKAQHLAAIASGRLQYENMVREGASVRRYGKIAITNGTVRVKGKIEQQTFEVLLLYTAVYRRQKGRWQLLNWQSTKINNK